MAAKTITNRTDLLAFIYDPETLPTALIEVGPKIMPASVHSLREGPESLVDRILSRADIDPSKEFQVKAYPFWDQYDVKPSQFCLARYQVDEETLPIVHIEEWATKSFEECA